jgi:hypothetical protein
MDLVIPLNATSRLSSAALEERYQGRVQEALARARLEGWHAEDPIDWASTSQAGRLTRRMGRGFLGLGQPRYVYESVTIRLTRHVPMRHANRPGSET